VRDLVLCAKHLFWLPRSPPFSLPTRATTVPTGPDWLHEIKYDGYRLRLERDGDRVRLITRGGYNWADPTAIPGLPRRR
jgi:ATP-dependent DNA ligase